MCVVCVCVSVSRWGGGRDAERKCVMILLVIF